MLTGKDYYKFFFTAINNYKYSHDFFKTFEVQSLRKLDTLNNNLSYLFVAIQKNN